MEWSHACPAACFSALLIVNRRTLKLAHPNEETARKVRTAPSLLPSLCVNCLRGLSQPFRVGLYFLQRIACRTHSQRFLVMHRQQPGL